MSDTKDTYRLFQEALRNPVGISEEDLLSLIARYPYAQPLRYALVRRNTLLHTKDTIASEQARMFAFSATWLYAYAHKPGEVVEEVECVSEDYVPFEEEVVAVEPEIEDVDAIAEDEVVEDENTEEDAVVEQESDEAIETDEEEALEKLVQGAGVAADYFVFEKKEQPTEDPEEAASSDIVPAKKEIDAEKISLYNDELMPYSFRWWLHKTRLEHADTYQPFATPVLPRPQKGQFDPRKLDEAILDQQIKENIIHLQDPEAKLSDAVKEKPVESSSERKDTKIIERFIRKEPIIQPPSPEQLNTENMARQSAEDNYTLVTETLANIYTDQGLYLKAIEVFKKLILKYPEKKSYFATRIQELEKNL